MVLKKRAEIRDLEGLNKNVEYSLIIKLIIVFFFKQKTAYEFHERLVGSEMCIRDSNCFFANTSIFRSGG